MSNLDEGAKIYDAYVSKRLWIEARIIAVARTIVDDPPLYEDSDGGWWCPFCRQGKFTDLKGEAIGKFTHDADCKQARLEKLFAEWNEAFTDLDEYLKKLNDNG